MDISTTETRTAIGKPLQMRKQYQRSLDATLCRKTNKNDKRQNSNSFIPISWNNDSYKYSYFPKTLITGMEQPTREGRQPENWRHSRPHSTFLLNSRVKW
jgi:hypothetical protein